MAEDGDEEEDEEGHGEGVGKGGPLLRQLQRLTVWDAAFFVRIARCGYELEQWHAFMPGLPTLLRSSVPRRTPAAQHLQASQSSKPERTLPLMDEPRVLVPEACLCEHLLRLT